MSKKDIKVPNIGEFKDVEIIEVLVKKGQTIKNDPLVTIESDKSSVEIPSTDNGVITLLNVKVGDKVSEGDKILEIGIEEQNIKKENKESSKNRNFKENIQEVNLDKKEKKLPKYTT